MKILAAALSAAARLRLVRGGSRMACGRDGDQGFPFSVVTTIDAVAEFPDASQAVTSIT